MFGCGTRIGGIFLADNEKDNSYFESIDVSEPLTPRKEKEIIREAVAMQRRDWIKAHMTYIFAAVGVIVVALIVFFIYMYYQNSNPMGRFVSSISKDFGTSFDFDVKITEDGTDMMRYTGAVEFDRSKYALEALYDADYGRYTYTGAVYADNTGAAKGSLYKEKWSVYECSEQVQNFFEFDRSVSSGRFNSGALLRFTGLSPYYSADELESFVGVLRKRLSIDSAIAAITSSKVDDGTRYDYDINLYELFSMIQEDGAPVFYRLTDYDKFTSAFHENIQSIQNAKCTVSFFVDASGYMTQLDMTVTADDTQFGLSCAMSNFGSAEVEVPQDFLNAAAQQ